MRKVLVSLLMAAVLGTSLTACSSTGSDTKVEQGSKEEMSITPQQFIEKLTEKELMAMPMEVDEAMATEMFHLNMDDVEEYAIAKPMMSAATSFAVVVKAKEGKVDAVKASVEKILADEVGNAFYPAQQEAAEKAQVEVKGNYVSLFIYEEEGLVEVQKLYEESFK